ncbi:MAG: NAD(P)-dependent oxidoreductase [Planctomycetota bacterium]
MQGRVVVTGVTGMIGSRLARWLAEEGCEVHGLARFSRARPSEDEVRSWGVRPWRRDLTTDRLDDLPDADYVFHEACQWDAPKGESEDPGEVAGWNATMALRVMYRWRRAKAVVLASTGGVLGQSGEPATEEAPPAPDAKGYHLGKFAMEEVALGSSIEFGTPTAILRYFWPVDFDERAASYVRSVREGKPVPGTGAEHPYRWTPIDLPDVCTYTVRSVEVASSPPAVLLCGGPEVVSRRRLVEIAAEELGREPVFDERAAGWQEFLADSSRLYELLGEPARRLTDVVRSAARAARS